MRLVSDWKEGYKWLSMHFVAAAATLQIAYLAFPQELRDVLPPEVQKVLVIVCLVGAVTGRFIDQKGKGNVEASMGGDQDR